MKDRIRLIMEKENLTPAKFADRLQINRAVISHILNGRNNPSLDVVARILSEMNYINSDWLINGTGEMYKEGYNRDGVVPESSPLPDLFSQIKTNASKISDENEKPQETSVKQAANDMQISENKPVEPLKQCVRKITQIIVYFDDNTFEVFGPPK